MEVEINCIWGLESIEVSRSFGEDLSIGRTAFTEAQDMVSKVRTRQSLFFSLAKGLIHWKMWKMKGYKCG